MLPGAIEIEHDARPRIQLPPDPHLLHGTVVREGNRRVLQRFHRARVGKIDEDAGRLRTIEENGAFTRADAPAPFLMWVRRHGVELPRAMGRGRWQISLTPDGDDWVSARTAYYPLWRARVQGAPVETRRGRLGDLQVRLDRAAGARTVELDYGPRVPEIMGIVVTVVGVVALIALRPKAAA